MYVWNYDHTLQQVCTAKKSVVLLTMRMWNFKYMLALDEQFDKYIKVGRNKLQNIKFEKNDK